MYHPRTLLAIFMEGTMKRIVEIVLSECSSKCPYFFVGKGLGHCDDWCDCTHNYPRERIHPYRNDVSVPFPDFCPLPYHIERSEGASLVGIYK